MEIEDQIVSFKEKTEKFVDKCEPSHDCGDAK